ncbi:hypothetical protein JW796_00740 [Candidatus Dojkabacteria bacterium]|nr:hypothetical protein [Candidatus Dojkabacteria bacterium]
MDQPTQENGVCGHPDCPFSGMKYEEIMEKIVGMRDPATTLFDVPCCRKLSYGVTGEALIWAASKAIGKCKSMSARDDTDSYAQEAA